MTCHCPDPIVFGHLTCQPPIPTYRPGETFTITAEATRRITPGEATLYYVNNDGAYVEIGHTAGPITYTLDTP